ncbi:MAG: site-specific integrase [Clostridia bacterium]|nr:site-specific integrase [Clostridia bacterium]
MKYKEWLKEWLENYVRPTTKMRTYTRYEEIVKQRLCPEFGEMELSQLTVDRIQRFIAELLTCGNQKNGKGLAPNSVVSIINVLQGSLKTAYMLGYVSEYHVDKVKRPKMKEKEVSCFSKREQKLIEEEVLRRKKDKLLGILLCLYTGLRIGELLALEWSDVDLQRGVIHVAKSCHDGKDENGKYKKIVEVPKTSSSVRYIPIPKQIMPMIRDMKKRSRSSFVVANGEKEVSVRSYQSSFAAILNKINIPHKGFHSLRHTFATRALECGMDVKTLSELLGHESATVTLKRYAHSLMDHKRIMMNKLGRFRIPSADFDEK